MAGREPAQITLTVFAARSLQSKRKGETCHASVVFGLGKEQYVTETIESSSPEWNQEATIKVSTKSHSQTIKFKVRDKDHVLGVVLLSVNNLDGQREASKRWLPLMPYKKAHEVSGELLVECFVSAYRPGQVISNSEKSSPMQSRYGSQEDILNPSRKGRFSFHRRTPSWSKIHSNMSATGASEASSLGDVSGTTSTSSAAEMSADPSVRRQVEPEVEMVKSVRNKRLSDNVTVSSSAPFQSHNLLPSRNSPLITSSGRTSPSSEVSLCPEVTGVSPREGPVEGGQRVVLRGSNLGESKEDVVKVVVADVDCTSSLEFSSPTKMAVVTPPRYAPGVGPVQVETRSGGLGVSSVTFAFVEKAVASPPEVSGVSPSSGSVGGGQKVVLRGNSLGECKEDVIRVVLAGIECTDTLEYFSPAKLVITTLPCPSVGSGKVLVETARGGVSKSSMVFSFVEEEVTAISHSRSMEVYKKHHQETHQAEVKALKQQIKDLRDDNSRLKEKNLALVNYVDNLLLSILDVRPDLLEIKPCRSTNNSAAASVTNLVQ